MGVDLNQEYVGISLRKVRDLLKKRSNDSLYTYKHIEVQLDIKPKHSKELLTSLVSNGYLEITKREYDKSKKIWHKLTKLGIQLKWTKAYPRISRIKAEDIIDRLKVKASEINENPDLLYFVKELRVFGSYIEPEKDSLGDIDIGYSLVFRPQYNSDNIIEVEKNRAVKCGVKLIRYNSAFHFGEKEIEKMLRKVSRYISLHPSTYVELYEVKSVVLYTWSG